MKSWKPGMLAVPCLAMAAVLLVAGPAAAQDRGRVAKPEFRPETSVPRPDLVVEDITFQIVKRTKDAMGKPCMVFNVRPVIANLGSAASHSFRVTVQWNKGPGGAFQQACPLCQWMVDDLVPGQKKTLDARQFNNCGVTNLKFRIFVDTDSQVPESNELNNARVESPSFLKAPPKFQRKLSPAGSEPPLDIPPDAGKVP